MLLFYTLNESKSRYDPQKIIFLKNLPQKVIYHEKLSRNFPNKNLYSGHFCQNEVFFFALNKQSALSLCIIEQDSFSF